MILGAIQVELFIPESGSLKSKRKILKSIKDRLRQRFNVSVCEADYQDKWQRTTLAVVTVGTETKFVNHVLDEILKLLESELDIQVLDTTREVG